MKAQSQFVSGTTATSTDAKHAGVLFIFVGAVFILLVTLLESLYPDYSIHSNTISDLLAVGKETAYLGEPVMFIIAAAWIAGGYYLARHTGKVLLVLNIMPGTGLLLAVLSPENVNIAIHSVGAVLAFFISPVVMLLTLRSINTSFRYFTLALAITSLSFAVLEFGAYYSSLVQQTFGPGGAERMIIYPIMIWLIGYGSHLLGKGHQS